MLRRIKLIHCHEGGLGFLGPFTALREEPDGLYGDALVIRSRADDVEDLIGSGVKELSVEFHLPKTDHTEVVDGVRWRVRAHLHQVALEAKGAYRNAQVMAYRAEVDEAEREAAEAAQKAADEAAAQAAADQAEAAKRAEAEAEAADRRRRWQEMTSASTASSRSSTGT